MQTRREMVMRNGICTVMILSMAVLGCGPVPSGAPGTQETAQPAPSDAKSAACINNIQQLGIGCKLYATEHDGRFPETIQELQPEYCPYKDNFVCPAAAPITPPADGTLASDYEIVPGLTDKSPAKAILIREKGQQNHTAPGYHILHVDGSVLFVK